MRLFSFFFRFVGWFCQVLCPVACRPSRASNGPGGGGSCWARHAARQQLTAPVPRGSGNSGANGLEEGPCWTHPGARQRQMFPQPFSNELPRQLHRVSPGGESSTTGPKPPSAADLSVLPPYGMAKQTITTTLHPDVMPLLLLFAAAPLLMWLTSKPAPSSSS
jgi:hypothetical protein